jgi:hypothetical protein
MISGVGTAELISYRKNKDAARKDKINREKK